MLDKTGSNKSDTMLAETIRHGLNQFLSHYKAYSELFIVNPVSGLVEVSTNVTREGNDKSMDKYFTEPLRTGKIYIKDIYYSKALDMPAMTFSMPIFASDNTGRIIGVLVARIDMQNSLYTLLSERAGMGLTGETLIVNNNVVAVSKLRWHEGAPLQLKINAIPAINASHGKTGIIETADYRDVDVLAAYTYIPRTKWGFVAKQDLVEVYAPIRGLINNILILMACCSVATIALAFYFARHISRPIRHLSRVSQQIEDGNLNVQAQITTFDEIGTLANAFNDMLNSIKTSQHALKKHRDHLEYEVQERTSELITVNKDLTNEIAERKHSEDAMNTLVMTTIETEGQKFFEQIVSSLYDWLGVDCVILGQLIDENNETALAMKQDGEFVDNFSYELQGSPCGDVSKKNFCFYPEGVIDLFPDDKALVQWNIEGYVGVSLKGKSGNCIGTLCALSHRKLELPSGAENVFKIISARASVELERMLTEKRVSSLARILEESLNEVFIFDADTLKFVQVNKGGRKNLGYSNKELMEITPIEIKPEFTRESFEKKIKPLRSGEKELIVFESVHQRKNGSLYDVEVHLQLSTFESAPAFVAIILDITDRKNAENALLNAYGELENRVKERTAELTEANIKLKELDRLKSMFIASMSHELRTPLNSIIGFTGIILQGMDGEINPQQIDHLGRVNRSAKHLLTLINDIIDLSKVEAGKTDVFLEDVVLGEVINEAVDNVRLQANEKGLSMDVSVPQDIRMNTDRKRLYQCILNYLSNAVKFTEAGTISITTHEANGEVEITVSDTGIGISNEDQQRLFKPFTRIDSHLRTKTLGTGLGLYLTRKLTTELLGGTVDVQSQSGKGSTFSLKLPKERRNMNEDSISH